MSDKTLNSNKRHIVTAFLLLLVMFLYMYINTSYELSTGSNYGYHQLWRLDAITAILRYSALLLLLVVSNRFYRKSLIKNKSAWFISCLMLFMLVFFWFMEAVISSNFQAMVYSVTSPLVYLTAISMFIGFSDYGFDCFAKLCLPISCILIALSIISYFLFLLKFPVGLLADSSALTYYVNGFWLFAISMVYRETHHIKGNRILTWIVLILLVALAVLFNSRGWVIQSFLLLLLNVYMISKGKKLKTVFIVVLAIVVIICIIVVVMENYFPTAWEYMQLKLNKDTRSNQYQDIFSQVSALDLLLGKGYHFTYNNGIKSDYAYIDNSFLFVLVRYGIAMFILYYWIYIYPLKALFISKIDKTTHYYSLILLMWLAALGGLSIFCAISIDMKSIAMSIVAGRCIAGLSKLKETKYNRFKTSPGFTL